MKTAVVIGSALIIAGLLVAAGTGVLGQRGPGQFQPGMQPPMGGPGGPGHFGPPPVAMKSSETGVFVLTGGTLTKFAAGTLREQGALELVTRPEVAPNPDEQRSPMPPRGIMLLTKDGADVVVLLGDQFFRVDAATFKVAAEAALPKPELPENISDDQNRPLMPPPGPGCPPELQGRTLYLMQANKIIAIDIDTGKVVAQAALPAPPLPAN